MTDVHVVLLHEPPDGVDQPARSVTSVQAGITSMVRPPLAAPSTAPCAAGRRRRAPPGAARPRQRHVAGVGEEAAAVHQHPDAQGRGLAAAAAARRPPGRTQTSATAGAPLRPRHRPSPRSRRRRRPAPAADRRRRSRRSPRRSRRRSARPCRPACWPPRPRRPTRRCRQRRARPAPADHPTARGIDAQHDVVQRRGHPDRARRRRDANAASPAARRGDDAPGRVDPPQARSAASPEDPDRAVAGRHLHRHLRSGRRPARAKGMIDGLRDARARSARARISATFGQPAAQSPRAGSRRIAQASSDTPLPLVRRSRRRTGRRCRPSASRLRGPGTPGRRSPPARARRRPSPRSPAPRPRVEPPQRLAGTEPDATPRLHHLP